MTERRTPYRKNQIGNTDNGTCNAYLKDAFRFYLFLAECGYVQALRVLSYNQITVPDAVGVKRTIRSRLFKGYMKEMYGRQQKMRL